MDKDAPAQNSKSRGCSHRPSPSHRQCSTGSRFVKGRDKPEFGWPEKAPFDAIIVTAAPDHIPQPLLDQLTPAGRLVVPVGPPGGYQTLWQLVREGEDVRAYNIGGVRFVPLVGGGQTGRGLYEDRFGEGEQRQSTASSPSR
jgi:hypothetical protein